MNKEQFFANELIASFLHDLHKGLMNLPTSAREQHMLEIKSDLYENALCKESEGIPLGIIPSQVIEEFLPPKISKGNCSRIYRRYSRCTAIYKYIY